MLVPITRASSNTVTPAASALEAKGERRWEVRRGLSIPDAWTAGANSRRRKFARSIGPPACDENRGYCHRDGRRAFPVRPVGPRRTAGELKQPGGAGQKRVQR